VAEAAPLLPGATIGVLGSGQLGRMLAQAARRMGYRVAVYSDDRSGSTSPAGQAADHEVVAGYDHPTMVEIFARGVDAVTVEFENIPLDTLHRIEATGTPVRPGPAVVATAQHRGREKSFFRSVGVPTTEFGTSLATVGLPAIAKTQTLGYDGKGQWRLAGPADADLVPADADVLYEAQVELAAECSVVAARNPAGEVALYPAFENHHVDGILDWTVAPARLGTDTVGRAAAHTRAIVEALDAVGVLCVEFFVTAAGEVLANEFAPRPHNSGHLSIEANATSQFEQQLRAAAGLGLGSTELHRPAAMANLLGDLWARGEPDWASALSVPGVNLHLYGKAEARPGRKMGHLTALASTPTEALDRVLEARRRLDPQERA